MRDLTLTSERVRELAGRFFASAEFDPYFERIHTFSRTEIIAGMCLAPLFGRMEAFKGAVSKLRSGDFRSDGLRRRYAKLGERGQVIFTYVIVCNAALKRKPGLTAPALMMGNFNGERDEMALLELRERLAELALGEDVGPDDRQVARLLGDLGYQFRRRRSLPRSSTGGVEVTAFDLMIVGDFLPTATLQIEAIPCLAEPGRTGLIAMIPFSIIEQCVENRAPSPAAASAPSPARKPDHFSSIGFRVDSERDLRRMARETAQRFRRSSGPGPYIHCATPEGAELWAQTNSDGQIVGCNPHFAGNSRYIGTSGFDVDIGQVIENDRSFLDGTIMATIADPDAAGCPIVFDVPDFRASITNLRLPVRASVQIAAFAHELSIAENEAAFAAQQSVNEMGVRLAAESFIPSGTFVPGGEPVEPPVAHAVLAGRIIDAELRTNSATGLTFHALTVKTLGGMIDVVADPQLVKTKPAPGGIISGSFWLSARIRATCEVPPPLPPA